MLSVHWSTVCLTLYADAVVVAGLMVRVRSLSCVGTPKGHDGGTKGRHPSLLLRLAPAIRSSEWQSLGAVARSILCPSKWRLSQAVICDIAKKSHTGERFHWRKRRCIHLAVGVNIADSIGHLRQEDVRIRIRALGTFGLLSLVLSFGPSVT